MERKTYFILGSLLFLLIFIIYRLKTSGEDSSITTPINSPENLDDFKRAINKLIKVIDKDRKSNKLLLNEIQKMNKLNKLHTRYLQDIQPKIFNKDIEKQRIYIDTHNIRSTFNRAKYTYYLDSSDTNNQNDAAGYGGGFNNVIGFRLVKALIPNTHDVVGSDGLVIWVKLTDTNINNVFGLELNGSGDQIISYIGNEQESDISEPHRYHDRDEIMQIQIPRLSLTAQGISKLFTSTPDDPSQGAIYTWKNSTPDFETYTGNIGNGASLYANLADKHDEFPQDSEPPPQIGQVIFLYFLKSDLDTNILTEITNLVGWSIDNIGNIKYTNKSVAGVQLTPIDGHEYYRIQVNNELNNMGLNSGSLVTFIDNRPIPTGHNFIYNKCKRSPEEDLESLYGLTATYNRDTKKFVFRCTGRGNNVLDKYKRYILEDEETYGNYGDTTTENLTYSPLNRDISISSTSNNSINFEFLWDDLHKYFGGIFVNQLLGFNQINIGNNENKALESSIHPNMITHYIDLIIDEIPYIACKKNALGRKLIERIGLMGGLGELVEYIQPWDSDNENFFYPINLTRLNIEIYSHESHKLFDNTRDHSLEFEITTIKNPKKFNLI